MSDNKFSDEFKSSFAAFYSYGHGFVAKYHRVVGMKAISYHTIFIHYDQLREIQHTKKDDGTWLFSFALANGVVTHLQCKTEEKETCCKLDGWWMAYISSKSSKQAAFLEDFFLRLSMVPAAASNICDGGSQYQETKQQTTLGK